MNALIAHVRYLEFQIKEEKTKVMIMIRDFFDVEVHQVLSDDNGRIVIVHATIFKEELVLVNAYFPTKDNQKDQVKTLKTLTDMLTDFDGKSLIIGGDFNIALDLDLDKHGGRKDKSESKLFRLELTSFIGAYELQDILRVKNSNKHLFTWHSKHLKVSTRLDYFFISEHLSNKITNSRITSAILTDHRLVEINLRTNTNFDRGAGYWKFNTSLLHDKA